jgi:hypothetical protein
MVNLSGLYPLRKALQSWSMRRLKRIGGFVLLAWGVIRFIPDALESIQATAKYAKWSYDHLAVPRSGLLTLAIVLVGIGLIFSETIQKSIQAWMTASGITGNADLMLQELNLSDIKITNGGASYEINLAAFVRIDVASLDKPRTVKRFEIEMVAPDGTLYRANSEYEVGEYDHVYDIAKKDSWGLNRVERRREPMEDLAARVRTPIQPATHVPRAWVRFEINGVKQGHEPKNCTIRIFAIDPSEMRHEITTDAMQVRAIDEDREYAVVRGDESA